MTDLLYIMRLTRERGTMEREQRLQLMAHYVKAWMIFREALGDEFDLARGPLSITPAQLDVIENAVEKAYAGPLALHRLGVAYRQCGADILARLERVMEPIRRWRGGEL